MNEITEKEYRLTMRTLTAEINEIEARSMLEEVLEVLKTVSGLQNNPVLFAWAIKASKFLNETPSVKDRSESGLNWVEQIVMNYLEDEKQSDFENGEEIQQYIFDEDIARDIASDIESYAHKFVDWEKIFKALKS